jgi:multicomponent Na+:H+ antiporter subunit E
MKSKAILFIIAFFTWVLLTWSLDLEHLVVGILASILVSLVTGDIFQKKVPISKSIDRYLWFFYYIAKFIWECLKANIDGAYRVIHPDLPINPGIVKVKTGLKSDMALTFLANSLTLQPGTMTVDIDKENGFLYIHWIDVKSQDIEQASKMITEKFERILKRIFE